MATVPAFEDAFSSQGWQSALKAAMNSVGLTVDAAVQTDLSFPVGAEVQAAEVASTLTAPAPAHAAGDQPGAAEVDAAVAEPPRPTLQELKEALHACTTQLREQQAADALESYNIMAKLYNKSQLARLYISDGRLLPLKDAEGNLPPAGLFPTMASSVQRLFVTSRLAGASYQPYNERVCKLLAFYEVKVNGKPYPEREQLPPLDTDKEFCNRLDVLRDFLDL